MFFKVIDYAVLMPFYLLLLIVSISQYTYKIYRYKEQKCDLALK